MTNMKPEKTKRLIVEVSEKQLFDVKMEAINQGISYRKLVINELEKAGIIKQEPQNKNIV